MNNLSLVSFDSGNAVLAVLGTNIRLESKFRMFWGGKYTPFSAELNSLRERSILLPLALTEAFNQLTDWPAQFRLQLESSSSSPAQCSSLHGRRITSPAVGGRRSAAKNYAPTSAPPGGKESVRNALRPQLRQSDCDPSGCRHHGPAYHDCRDGGDHRGTSGAVWPARRASNRSRWPRGGVFRDHASGRPPVTRGHLKDSRIHRTVKGEAF